MSISTALGLIYSSAIATLLSIALAFIQAFFVPFVIEGTDVGARPPEQRTYTLEELEQAEREMNARLKARAEDKSFESHARNFRSMQRPALWISWVPWIVVPFFIFLSSIARFVSALIFPAVIVLTTLAPPESLAVYAVALLLGMGIRYAYARGHAT
jgi:hypothetical protein